MNAEWLEVPLGKVLKVSNDYVQIDPEETYKISGIYGWGRGMLTREPLQGKATSYKRFVRLHENDLALSHLKAWEGAIARVSKTYDGWFLSTQFSTFRPTPELLDSGYLEWFCKLPKLWETLEKGARGMGARRSTVSAEQFLSVPIPLPPLSEQQRIVERLEHLASKIEEARGLSLRSSEEANALIVSSHLKSSQDRDTARVSKFLQLEEHKEPVVTTESYPQVGIYSFGRGLFAREAVQGSQTTYKAFNKLFEGAFILSQVKGWEGAVAVCGSDFAGRFVSPEYRTFRCIGNRAIPEYLAALVTTSWFHNRLKDLTRGAGARRERVRPELFLNLELPMPSVEEQKRIVKGLKHLDPLMKLQGQTRGELDALLPSVLDKAFRGEL